eukprot:3308853-Amphidinium_carterae.1
MSRCWREGRRRGSQGCSRTRTTSHANVVPLIASHPPRVLRPRIAHSWVHATPALKSLAPFPRSAQSQNGFKESVMLACNKQSTQGLLTVVGWGHLPNVEVLCG